jgi:hypothetical protein
MRIDTVLTGLLHSHIMWIFDEQLAGTRRDSRGNMKDSLAAPWFYRCTYNYSHRPSSQLHPVSAARHCPQSDWRPWIVCVPQSWQSR